MRTCSIPSNNRIGQSRSANCAANTSAPREVFGAAFFAASATPKCPRNIVLSADTREIQSGVRVTLWQLRDYVKPVQGLAQGAQIQFPMRPFLMRFSALHRMRWRESVFLTFATRTVYSGESW